jgi:type IV secretion system protein VirD4
VRKKARAKSQAPAPLVPDGTPGRPWYGCYVGEVPNPPISKGEPPPIAPLYAGPESAVLIVGPPRSGKTTTLVIPTVLDAPAAVVSTSTKTDIMFATAVHRTYVGRVYLFDPTDSVEVPGWVTKMRWSPVVGCQKFDRAVTVAHALAAAARPGASLSESAHWVERAEALLGPLLFAAATASLEMATLYGWVLSRDLQQPQAIIAEAGHELAAAVLAGVVGTEERERSGIFSTASGLLSAYRSETVLAAASHPNFRPEDFVESSDTLYVCASAQDQDQLAPLVVALLEQVRFAALARPADAAPLVFALDEVANIAPLPSLPTLAAEGGGQGVVTLACLQDLSQARVRWGQAAEGFFTLFGVKVILPGVADHRTLELISALAGDQAVRVPSVTNTGSFGESLFGGQRSTSITTSIVWRPRLPIDAISRGKIGHGLLINGSYMSDVRLLPWRAHGYWGQLVQSHVPS